MPRLLSAMVVLGLVFMSAGSALAGDITYTMVNDTVDQNGYSLTGTIVTDGTIGALAYTDIVSWQFTITGPGGPYTNSGTTSSRQTLLENITATATAIQLPMGVGFTGVGVLELGERTGGPVLQWSNSNSTIPEYYASANSTFLWAVSPPTGYGPGSWAVATVPEPSSFILAGFGTVIGLAYGWCRHDRAQRRPSPVDSPDVTE
jgi:hypothetical protein